MKLHLSLKSGVKPYTYDVGKLIVGMPNEKLDGVHWCPECQQKRPFLTNGYTVWCYDGCGWLFNFTIITYADCLTLGSFACLHDNVHCRLGGDDNYFVQLDYTGLSYNYDSERVTEQSFNIMMVVYSFLLNCPQYFGHRVSWCEFAGLLASHDRVVWSNSADRLTIHLAKKLCGCRA